MKIIKLNLKVGTTIFLYNIFSFGSRRLYVCENILIDGKNNCEFSQANALGYLKMYWISMKKKFIREKRHRLDADIYNGERPIAFTLCMKDNNHFFINEARFKIFEKTLIGELKNYNCSAYVYIFMPDHVHMILAGNDSEANIKKCLEMFKQKTGYFLSKNFTDFKWQKDYYDHILRSKENLDMHIKYVLNNPVRAGIVEFWKQYKYKGSTVYDLNEWAANW